MLLRCPTRCRCAVIPLSFGLLLAFYGCDSKKEVQKPHPAQQAAQSNTQVIKAVRAPTRTTQVLKKRIRYVYPGGDQGRKAWAKRLILEERFEKSLCADGRFLRSCIRSFRHPHTRVKGPFTKRDCFDAVRDIVSKELGAGRGKLGLVGAFLTEELPKTVKAGRDMDLFADRLARRILNVLLPAIRKFGGHIDTSKECTELSARAQEVNGN